MASSAPAVQVASAPGIPAPRPRFHYAWVVVAAAFVIGSINAAFMWAFTLVLGPIRAQFGWSSAETSIAYMLQYLIFALGSIFGGMLVDRIGARAVLVGGSLFLIASMSLTSTVSELWQFYLYFGILLGVSRSAFIAPLHTVVGLWFRKRLGVAMGLVSAALGVGPFLFVPIMQRSIESIGWQQALLWIGLASGIVMTLMSLLIRNNPADMKLLPYGATGTLDAPTRPPVQRGRYYDGSQKDQFLRHARRTQPFYFLIGIHFLGCLGHSVLLAHAAPMIARKGMTPEFTALVIALISGLSVLGYFIFSIFADKQDGRSSLVVAFLCQTAGILMLVFAQQDWQFYLFALFFGLGMGGEMVVFPVINRQYYGSAPVGTLYGVQMFGAGIGMGLGALAGGILYDQTGDYLTSILFAAGVTLLGIVLILALAMPVTQALRAVRRREAAADAAAEAGAAVPGSVPAPVAALDPAPAPIARTAQSATVSLTGASADAFLPAAGVALGDRLGWTEWIARRRAFEIALARELSDWAGRTSDDELGEVLEIAAARSRDRAFRLRRSAAGADAPALPAVSELVGGPAGAAPDVARIERVLATIGAELALAVDIPGPAEAALHDQMEASTRETLDLIAEQLHRLAPAPGGQAVRPIEPGPAHWLEEGCVFWKRLSGGLKDSGAAVVWVSQWPGSRTLWEAGSSRVLLVLEGRGQATGPGTAPLPLDAAAPVEAGRAAFAEVEAQGDLPLTYLVIADQVVEPVVRAIVTTEVMAAAPANGSGQSLPAAVNGPGAVVERKTEGVRPVEVSLGG